MTFNVLKYDIQKIAFRSNVRPADNTLTSNLRVDPATMPAIIKYRQRTLQMMTNFLLMILLFL